MLARVVEPVGQAGAEVGGFKAGGGELVEGVPFEADPVFCGGEGLVRREALDGQLKDQIDLGLLFAVLDKALLAAAKEAARLRSATELFLNLAHQGLAGGLAEVDVATWQVGDTRLLAKAEQNLVLHDADSTGDHFNVFCGCHETKYSKLHFFRQDWLGF